MACGQTGTKPLPQPLQTYNQFSAQEQTSGKSKSNKNIFIQWDALANAIYKMLANSFSP